MGRKAEEPGDPSIRRAIAFLLRAIAVFVLSMAVLAVCVGVSVLIEANQGCNFDSSIGGKVSGDTTGEAATHLSTHCK